MTSTTKERQRRDAIEADYVTPPDPAAAHDPEPDERPLNAQRAIEALTGHGFTIQEKAAIVWDLPRWKTANPDDANLSYVADELPVYHLVAWRTSDALAAVQVMYLGGKVARSWLGYGTLSGDGHWETVPIASLAKAIRESLA